MTRSSSFAAEVLLLVGLGACTEQPAVLMHVERAASEPLSLYVCARGGTACEMWKIYDPAPGPRDQSVAVYVRDDTPLLELNFQQVGSVGCERIDVDVAGEPIEMTVTLGMPLAVTGCPSGRCTGGLPCTNH